MTETGTAIDRNWLLARITEIIGDDEPVGSDEDLTLYGLDSMGVMRVIMALDEQGIEIGFDDLARQPTLDGWWAEIARRQARHPGGPA